MCAVPTGLQSIFGGEVRHMKVDNGRRLSPDGREEGRGEWRQKEEEEGMEGGFPAGIEVGMGEGEPYKRKSRGEMADFDNK